jgi:hypothetical protein
VVLLSQTHLKPHERFYIPNYQLYRTDRFLGIKGGTAVAVKKGIPHSHVDLPPIDSLEATGVCIPIGNSELLLANAYKCPGKAWRDADIIELLQFRRKSVLAGDLYAKHPVWNSAVSNSSRKKILDLLHIIEFDISAPQCPTHYTPAGNGDVLDIVVRQNIRMSEVIVSDVLDSYHLPIDFHTLDHVTTRNLSDPVEKFTDWGRFQSLASDLVSLRIQINSEVETDKVASDFTASIALSYRLATSKGTLSDMNSNLPSLDRLLKHKNRLRKLWHESRNPSCKTAVHWIVKTIRRMSRRKSFERREKRVANYEATPQALWPIVKCLLKGNRSKAKTAIHCSSGLKFHPLEKANAISGYLENLLTPHDLFDESNERLV